ncbi:MAG: outer membrane lipoprotein-sorting protein [Exilibacterium sp.]
MSILLSPSSEKGISFLQYDYEDVERDSDQWIYLSALKKVKRIVTSGDNEPKKGSFFGSEFSYEDMEQRQLDDYTYKLVGSEQYNQRECSVVESTPKPKQAKRSLYSKSISWIDKERNMDMNNMQTKRISTLTLEKVILNMEVKDSFLSQRTLTDSLFRESSLKAYQDVINNQ